MGVLEALLKYKVASMAISEEDLSYKQLQADQLLAIEDYLNAEDTFDNIIKARRREEVGCEVMLAKLAKNPTANINTVEDITTSRQKPGTVIDLSKTLPMQILLWSVTEGSTFKYATKKEANTSKITYISEDEYNRIMFFDITTVPNVSKMNEDQKTSLINHMQKKAAELDATEGVKGHTKEDLDAAFNEGKLSYKDYESILEIGVKKTYIANDKAFQTETRLIPLVDLEKIMGLLSPKHQQYLKSILRKNDFSVESTDGKYTIKDTTDANQKGICFYDLLQQSLETNLDKDDRQAMIATVKYLDPHLTLQKNYVKDELNILQTFLNLLGMDQAKSPKEFRGIVRANIHKQLGKEKLMWVLYSQIIRSRHEKSSVNFMDKEIGRAHV